MPELPEVERVRRLLTPALVGARFLRVRLNRADLRRPFPPDFAVRLRGRSVRALTRRGKYLVAHLSSGDTLVMHLGMSGSFRIERSRRRRPDREIDLERRHDHVIFEMSSRQTVTFNDPRRFGVMQLLAAADSETSGGFGSLGPEPLVAGFTPATLARGCAGRRITLKAALLDQTVVAGLGNIYASEALHLAHLSPLRLAKTIATSTGAPRPSAVALTAAIKRVLRRAIARRGGIYDAARFRVYDREGQACPTPGCRGTIARIVQSGRSTFYCPACQR